MLNTTLDYFDNIKIDKLEKTMGKCLNQPHSNTNSASRKLMLSPQQDQRFALYDSEVPISSTGYENKFAENNSSFITTDRNYEVVAIISKFKDLPKHNYILVLRDPNTNQYTIHERIHYKHNSETYGFIFNNEFVDSLQPGYTIPLNTVIQKSTGYDEENNRKDGRNGLTTYMSLGLDMEDGIIISESYSTTLDAPLIKKVTVMVNKNNIPLNLYGDENIYKSFPNIGEYVKDGLLYASRLEKKEECLFSQSVDRLKKTFISDDKNPVIGKVIDINIHCNEPEHLNENYYNSQLAYYYNNSMRYSREIVQILKPIIDDPNCISSYELKSLFLLHERILNKSLWAKDNKSFNFCMVEFIIEERNKVQVGDKIADRYGGKGVIAAILPDSQMPRLENGKIIEVIIDSNSTISRLNPGQLFEISTNMAGNRLLEYIDMGICNPGEEIETYCRFLDILAPTQAMFIRDKFSKMSEEDIGLYLNCITDQGEIYTCTEPIQESLTLDKLDMLYKEFPFIKPYIMMVPQEDSNGNIRYIKSRRTLVAGKKYYYRLKQYAKEKSSATSLSSTNIKGLNTKSRASKDYKSSYSSTPTTFGNMEHANKAHIDPEVLVINLMLHSASPHGRKLASTIYESSDPFQVDIKLDDKAKNRNVEILNAYLKGKGLCLEFYKIPRQLEQGIMFNAIEFMKPLDYGISWKLAEGQLEHGINIYESPDGLQQAILFNGIKFYD